MHICLFAPLFILNFPVASFLHFSPHIYYHVGFGLRFRFRCFPALMKTSNCPFFWAGMANVYYVIMLKLSARSAEVYPRNSCPVLGFSFYHFPFSIACFQFPVPSSQLNVDRRPDLAFCLNLFVVFVKASFFPYFFMFDALKLLSFLMAGCLWIRTLRFRFKLQCYKCFATVPVIFCRLCLPRKS